MRRDGPPAGASTPPDAEHKRLDDFVGRWHTEGETEADDTGPAVKIVGTDSYEWLPGGFFRVHRVDVLMGEKRVEALEIIGYDAASGTYPVHAFDSAGNAGTMRARVRDGVWTFAGESERATVTRSADG